jgi:hypothetical protein
VAERGYTSGLLAESRGLQGETGAFGFWMGGLWKGGTVRVLGPLPREFSAETVT